MKAQHIPCLVLLFVSLASLSAAEDQAQPMQVPANGPVARYDFNDYDPANGLVHDQSGNGFDLHAVAPMAEVVRGISRNAVMLKGGFFQGKGNPLAGTSAFTVAIWFKAAEPMNNYKLIGAAVWSGGKNASGWNIGTHYSEFWADNQQGSLRGGPDWDRKQAFDPNVWNHLALTYDGDHVREYINGRLATEIPGTGLRVGEGAPMTVGSWMGGFRFQGAIDEIVIHRRAFSHKEVVMLYQVPLAFF